MDYEKMWMLLKKYLMSKNSHGKNELLNEMMRMEIEAAEGVKKDG